MRRADRVEDRNSLAKGLRIGWVTIVVGYLVVGIAAAFLVVVGTSPSQLGPAVERAAWLVPWLAYIVAVVFHVMHGEFRTAAGIGLAAPSILGLVLALVAVGQALVALAFR